LRTYGSESGGCRSALRSGSLHEPPRGGTLARARQIAPSLDRPSGVQAKVGARLRACRAASASHTDPAHTPCDNAANSAPPGHAAHVCNRPVSDSVDRNGSHSYRGHSYPGHRSSPSDSSAFSLSKYASKRTRRSPSAM